MAVGDCIGSTSVFPLLLKQDEMTEEEEEEEEAGEEEVGFHE